MSGRSKFAGLGKALKEKRGGGQGAAPKKIAKSQDKETYAQTTVYLHRRDVYDPLQSALSSARLEYSQLVEDLLKEWLAKRPDVQTSKALDV